MLIKYYQADDSYSYCEMLKEIKIGFVVQKVMKGIGIVLNDLGPPEVVVANTYFWKGAYSPDSCKVYKEVEEWINDIADEFDIPLVCEKGLRLEIYYNGEKVGFFSYGKSRRNVYKHQSLSAITRIVKNRVDSLKSSIKVLMDSGYDEVQALRIAVAQDMGFDSIGRFVNPGYEAYHIFFIRKLLERGIEPSSLPVTEFDPGQVKEIVRGLNSGLNVMTYAKPFLSSSQMAEIREAMVQGIYVEIFTRPEVSDILFEEFEKYLKIFKKHQIKTEEDLKGFLDKLSLKKAKGKLKPPYDSFYNYLVKLSLGNFQKSLQEKQKSKKIHRSLKI